jgi:hypothetical protein
VTRKIDTLKKVTSLGFFYVYISLNMEAEDYTWEIVEVGGNKV